MDLSEPTAELWVCHLGLVEYGAALQLQGHLREQRQAGEIPDVLLTLQHPPVYTRGRRAHDDELPLGEAFYSAQGIAIVDTPRGGRVTYHGPGQLVGYPIMGVTDVVAYVRTMEAAIIAALAAEGVAAQVRDRLTGVWVGERKIASIGVHVARDVTTHGFAINVCNDLEPFSWIVPCGLDGVAMTSVSLERGTTVTVDCMRRHAAYAFAGAHGRRQRLVSQARLGLQAVARPLVTA